MAKLIHKGGFSIELLKECMTESTNRISNDLSQYEDNQGNLAFKESLVELKDILILIKLIH